MPIQLHRDTIGSSLLMNRMKIQVGTTDLDDQNSVFYAINNTIQYPKYNDITFVNDIALIRVKTKIKFGPLVQPICLPEYSFAVSKMRSRDLCVSTGFGRTDSGEFSLLVRI